MHTPGLGYAPYCRGREYSPPAGAAGYAVPKEWVGKVFSEFLFMANRIISLIIPIYRVEKTLPRCLDSVIGQSYRDLEIILVDDGSPDRSGEICDAYAARDPRMRVIHRRMRASRRRASGEPGRR